VTNNGDKAWIPISDDREWRGELASLRGEVVDPAYDRVDNIMAVHALDPGSLRAHLELYRQAMKGTAPLRKVDREMIALTVSTINECHY
jgi:alkylhydroperoxidase family enzyme